MASFSNPRLAALPCELMRGCSFAENCVTLTRMGYNKGTSVGLGNTANHGFTSTGVGYFTYDKVGQPGNFSVTVRFSATVTSTAGHLIGNNNLIASGIVDGFDIWVDANGVKARSGDGVADIAVLSVDLNYADGVEHVVTYVCDKDANTQTLYVDALTATSNANTAGTATGTTRVLWLGGGFKGTIYSARVFNATLTETEHDLYYANENPIAFYDAPTAAFKCDSWGDDTVGNYVWDRTTDMNDITKGDGTTAATFPTFVSDKYHFDLVDDYWGTWPTMPTAYTLSVAKSSKYETYPIIDQTNDNSFKTLLETTGNYHGYVHNAIIFPKVLTQLELYHAEYMQLYWLSRGRATRLYHRLITEGTCKLALFMDGVRGIFTNIAPLGDGGVATLVTRGSPAEDGCAFSSATSNVTFQDNTEHQHGDELTISVYGTMVINAIAPDFTAVDKGGNYKLKVATGVIDFNGSTFTPTGGSYEALTVTVKDGFKPRFYLDGEYVGEGSTTETLTADSTDLVIGNNNELNQRFRGTIKQVYIGDRALCDREVRELFHSATAINGEDMETGTRVEARRAPAVGAVNETVDPGDFFQLIDVVFVFDAAPTTSENITIKRITADADSLTEVSYDPSLSSDLTHIFRLDKRYMDDVTIDIDYANTDGNTITVITTYQLDTSVT